MTNDVARLFDAKAAGWAAKYAPDGPLAGRLAAFRAAVSRYAGPGDRILDLGCGTGELARALAAGGFRVTGCDISPRMLSQAARGRSGHDQDDRDGDRDHSDRDHSDCGYDSGGAAGWVRLTPGWRRLPFASAAFDVVAAASVLEYVAEPAGVLRECARVLRPGGVILYTVPDLRHPIRWAEWLARPLATGRGGAPAPRRERWRSYRAYLRTSRQRHRRGWWRAVSGSAGLRPLAYPADCAQPALQLLAFRRGDEAEVPNNA